MGYLSEHTLILIQDMFSPVRCRCGHVYDLGKVTVIARYADCSVWQCPGCKQQVDDRGETGWKSTQDYTRLDKNAGRHLDPTGRYMVDAVARERRRNGVA